MWTSYFRPVVVIQSYLPGGVNSTRMGESCWALSHISDFELFFANSVVLMIVGVLLYCIGHSLTAPVSLCILGKQDSCSFNQNLTSGWF